MLIDFQISERDYKHGFQKIMGPDLKLMPLLNILTIPLAGFLLIAIALRNFGPFGLTLKQAGPGLICLGLLLLITFPLYLISRSARNIARSIYRSTDWLRGRLFLDVNEDGIQFTGEGFYMKTKWAEFVAFSEDRRTFTLRQKTPAPAQTPFTFHIISKRGLSRDQVEGFRRYMQNKITSPKGISRGR